MQEQVYTRTRTNLLLHPKRLDMLFHAGKSLKLVGSLITDPRIAFWRKGLFFGALALLLALLLFPDVFGEFVLSTVLPLVGTVLGVPLDAGFDWLTFALVIVSLLRLFPPELVSEHYRSIFKK
jgi:hypothetical protein